MTAKAREMKLSVPEHGEVSALLEMPEKAKWLLLLAHGAGAGMHHPAMTSLAMALQAAGIATLRYQFPYMERGSKRVDSPKIAVATVAAAARAAAEAAPRLSLFAGGKSFGGRMTTTAAAEGELSGVRGIVCFGFPLHPAKKPSTTRAAHLAKLPVPTLFVSGTRDDLAELGLLREVVDQSSKRITLQLLAEADHGFGVRKSSGRTPDEVLAEVAKATREFCAKIG